MGAGGCARPSPLTLTTGGRPNHKVVSRPASSLAQDMESLPAEISVLIHYATPLTVHGLYLIGSYVYLYLYFGYLILV